jgi:glycosyltransferase involved in cell wall biosynthesis
VEAYARLHPQDEIICFTSGMRKPTMPDEIAHFSNIKQVHLSIPNKIWSGLSMFSLVSMVRATERRVGRVDAIFLPNVGFVGNLRGRPYTILVHDLSFLIEPRWFTRWQRLWHRAVHARTLIKRATAVLCVSETTRRDAVRILGVSEERTRVISLGLTLTNGQKEDETAGSHAANPYAGGRTQRSAPTGNRYALALGAGDARKNAATAIEAVRALRQEPGFEDVELILVGADRCVRHPWVHHVPRPSDAELAGLYQNTVAFLYPSWYEGYGLPLHEAAAFGTPRIASTAGALPETAPRNTIFAHPSKPHQWVEALRIALTTPRPDPIVVERSWDDAARTLTGFSANH